MDFLNRKNILENKLRCYLSGEITHEEICNYAWDVIEASQKIDTRQPYAEGEGVFWAAIWAIQHLADEGHWKEGITQKDLGALLKLLEEGKPLPKDQSGKRPNDKKTC